MIIDGVSVTIDESMFSDWVIWHGSGINAMHLACETNVPVTDGYRIPLEMLIRALLEHKCDRWAAASKGETDSELATSGSGSDPGVDTGPKPGSDSARRRRDQAGSRRRRANGSFTG